MPTPRAHGGAALLFLPLNIPAFRGLNTQNESALLGPEWATKLRNTTLDSSGRVSARKGWNAVTTLALGAAIVQSIEYQTHSGTRNFICSTATTFNLSTNGGATFSNITGAIAFTDGNWQFLNFNDDVYAVQHGKTPCRYNSGLGVFTAVADVNVPTGGVGLSAFGRLWIVKSDRITLGFSDLLDGIDWTTGDAGTLNMRNIWPGTDTIQALAAFNGRLVVFGKNNIAIFADATGSVLGIDPLAMYVEDTISGVGCIARDSLQLVDGDLWFLSASGLQSLGRLTEERNNPLDNLSRNVQDDLREMVAISSDVRSVYSPENRFYLLCLPSSGAGTVFVFDTTGRMEDGSVRCTGIWDGLVPTSIFRDLDGDLFLSIPSVVGKLGTYTGNLDNTSTYNFEYESSWLDITKQGYTIIPKRLSGVFYINNNVDIEFKWAYDFDIIFNTATRSFQAQNISAEWGLAEWGLSEWGGGISLRTKHVPGSGRGRYIKVGIACTINSTNISLQSLDLYAKIGRLT